MPVYIRFENNKQVETTLLSRKPSGTDWIKAPDSFDWHKCYCLDAESNIQERTEEDVSGEFLSNAKENGKATVTRVVDKFRRKYAGYSYEKGESYRVQAAAARSILQANKSGATADEDDLAVVQPLADLREIDVVEMATLIMKKARQAKRAMAKLEECEDKVESELMDCATLESVTQYLESLEANIETELNQGATNG